MRNIVLDEGNLRFSFSNVLHAVKYDEWAYYRNKYAHACGSSKAVDFVVVTRNELWLIEVKDYRRHGRLKEMDLWLEISLKVRDTMAGLVSAIFLSADGEEIGVAKEALSKKKLRVALHLEQVRKPSRLFPLAFNPANVQMKLKQSLKFADPHPIVSDHLSFPPTLGNVTII